MRSIGALATVFIASAARAHQPIRSSIKFDVTWTLTTDLGSVTLTVKNRGEHSLNIWPILDPILGSDDPRLPFAGGFWQHQADEVRAIAPTVRFLDRSGHPSEVVGLPINMPVPAPYEVAAGQTAKLKLSVGVGADFKDAAAKSEKIVLGINDWSKEISRVCLHKASGRWVQDS